MNIIIIIIIIIIMCLLFIFFLEKALYINGPTFPAVFFTPNQFF